MDKRRTFGPHWSQNFAVMAFADSSGFSAIRTTTEYLRLLEGYLLWSLGSPTVAEVAARRIAGDILVTRRDDAIGASIARNWGKSDLVTRHRLQ